MAEPRFLTEVILEPRPWQARELATHGRDPKRGIFASPRLGKTFCTAATVDLWRPSRTLIAAPLIVCPIWAQEMTMRGYDIVDMYSGSSEARLKRLVKAGRSGCVVINYDVIDRLIDDLIVWSPQAVVGDESHFIKGVSARRAKGFRRLAWRADMVRLLTGTPSPNHYGDLWGQLVALDKQGWGTYSKFSDRYLIRHAMFPSKVIGHRNVEELQARLLKYVTIVRREDEFGPDSWQYVTRTIALPPESRRLYDRLAREWYLEDEGIDASHILTRLIRLQQLSSGFLPTGDDASRQLHRAKVDAVLGDLDEIVESDEKAVIFHRFRPEGETYFNEVQTRSQGAALYRINGGTPIGERASVERAFRDHPGAAVLVAQTQAAGIGVSYAEATHALMVSRDFSWTTDQQARDRIYKPGATRVVTYYEMDRTVDQYIAKILAQKKNVHDSVTHADIAEMAYGIIG